MNFKVVENLPIIKTFTEEEDFYGSEELKRIWKGFQGLEARIRVMRKFEFIKGIKVATDPAKNFGRDFDLYRVYKTDDGMKCCAKQSIHACISNGGMRLAYLWEDEIALTDFYAEKTKSNREAIAQNDLLVVMI